MDLSRRLDGSFAHGQSAFPTHFHWFALRHRFAAVRIRKSFENKLDGTAPPFLSPKLYLCHFFIDVRPILTYNVIDSETKLIQRYDASWSFGRNRRTAHQQERWGNSFSISRSLSFPTNPLAHHANTKMRMQSLVRFTLFAALTLYSTQALCQAQQPSQSTWPATVQETVRDILAHMSDDDKSTLRKMKKEDLIRFHLSWGVGIRNDYGLWKGNNELILSACGHPCHPDDASMKIMEAVWDELHISKTN